MRAGEVRNLTGTVDSLKGTNEELKVYILSRSSNAVANSVPSIARIDRDIVGHCRRPELDRERTRPGATAKGTERAVRRVRGREAVAHARSAESLRKGCKCSLIIERYSYNTGRGAGDTTRRNQGTVQQRDAQQQQQDATEEDGVLGAELGAIDNRAETS